MIDKPSEKQSIVDAAAKSAKLSDEKLLDECDLEVFTGSGPGGQHRNKSETAVRLRHRPTGLVARATKLRSQLQNRNAALGSLRERLWAASIVPKKRRATKPSAGAKRRRLDSKKRIGEKKRTRRTLD
jgi:ribosome-associated protein